MPWYAPGPGQWPHWANAGSALERSFRAMGWVETDGTIPTPGVPPDPAAARLVKAINGKLADSAGAITLTAGDVGALTPAQLDALTTGAGRLSDASLRAAFGTVTGGVVLAAREGVASFAVGVIGDSTGNETGEWVGLTATKAAELFPTFEIRHHRWDDVNQRMPRPLVVRAAPAGERKLTLTGSAQAMPSWAAPAVTGDLDARIRVLPNSWGSGAEQAMVGQFPEAAENKRAWYFYLTASGALSVNWSTDGTTLQTAASSGAWTPPAGPLWVRVTLDVDNGASGHDIRFWQSPDGETWTQVGATVTRAGTTSLFNSTAPYQLGGRGLAAGVLAGSIYEVDVRAGIGDAPTVATMPALPEHWNATPATPSPTGSPILTFVNGSHPGANVAYLSDAARLGKMTPNYGQIIVLLSSSHNEASVHGAALKQQFKSWTDAIAARLPDVPVGIITQNPRIAPANRIIEQASRRVEYATWAQALGWTCIDTYAKFTADPRGVAALVNADGFHPNAAGSQLWATEVQRVLGLAT